MYRVPKVPKYLPYSVLVFITALDKKKCVKRWGGVETQKVTSHNSVLEMGCVLVSHWWLLVCFLSTLHKLW